jgi:hypothetical protein
LILIIAILENLGNLELKKLETGRYHFQTNLVSFVQEIFSQVYFEKIFKANWTTAKNFCEERGLQLAKMDSAVEMKLVSDARPLIGECFGARKKRKLQNASDFRVVLGGSVRRRTAARTILLDGRMEGGRRLVEK